MGKIPSRFATHARALAILLVALGLATGCAIKLAPDYDKTIVDGLGKANQDAMTLFASVAVGAKPDTFSKREDDYNKLIGKFDALRVQSNARPAPQPQFLQILGVSADVKKKLEAPTGNILENISGRFVAMREDDRTGHLNATAVKVYKKAYENWMDQALTYEKALER